MVKGYIVVIGVWGYYMVYVGGYEFYKMFVLILFVIKV